MCVEGVVIVCVFVFGGSGDGVCVCVCVCVRMRARSTLLSILPSDSICVYVCTEESILPVVLYVGHLAATAHQFNCPT